MKKQFYTCGCPIPSHIRGVERKDAESLQCKDHWLAARSAELATWEAEIQPPEIVGSPKQVAWARQIRHLLVRRLSDNPHLSDQYLQRVITERAARWFINNRFLGARRSAGG